MYTTALANGDVDAMDAMRAKDFVQDFVHRDAAGHDPASAEDVQAFRPAWLGAFQEFDYEVTRTIAAQEVVVAEWVFTGTHTGTIAPPIFDETLKSTGRTIRIRGVSVYDIRGELIQAETVYLDMATLMVELGAAQ